MHFDKYLLEIFQNLLHKVLRRQVCLAADRLEAVIPLMEGGR